MPKKDVFGKIDTLVELAWKSLDEGMVVAKDEGAFTT